MINKNRVALILFCSLFCITLLSGCGVPAAEHDELMDRFTALQKETAAVKTDNIRLKEKVEKLEKSIDSLNAQNLKVDREKKILESKLKDAVARARQAEQSLKQTSGAIQ